MTTTINAAVLSEPGAKLTVEELVLLPPREDEVVVAIASTGLCHSDLNVLTGGHRYFYPVVLGHEASGVVESVGTAVSYVKPGDHVIVSWVPVCGMCRSCLRGEPFICEQRWLLNGTLPDGTTRLRWGEEEVFHFGGVASLAEKVVVPESNLVRIDSDLPLGLMALLGCAVSTGIGAVLFTARVEPGDTVAVFGVGGVGLNIVQGAVLAAASRIIAVDVVEWKLRLAAKMGATDVVDASRSDAVAEILEFTAGGVDYAFEAVGTAKTIEQSLAATRKGGTAVKVGVTPQSEPLTLDPWVLQHGRSLVGCTYGSIHPRRDIPRLISLYRVGRIRLDELITRRISLHDVNEGFRMMESGEVLRAVVDL